MLLLFLLFSCLSISFYYSSDFTLDWTVRWESSSSCVLCYVLMTWLLSQQELVRPTCLVSLLTFNLWCQLPPISTHGPLQAVTWEGCFRLGAESETLRASLTHSPSGVGLSAQAAQKHIGTWGNSETSLLRCFVISLCCYGFTLIYELKPIPQQFVHTFAYTLWALCAPGIWRVTLLWLGWLPHLPHLTNCCRSCSLIQRWGICS